MTELASKYTPAEVEPQILQQWDEAKAFAASPDDPGEPYCIIIPPPNVTAALHMGHALNNTVQDILIRYHRMRGRNTLWMPGTDHAGIATQTIVEKRVLQEEGKRRTDFQRDQFVEKIQSWKDEYEKVITNQLKTMGCSCDWDRQRFTMDDICARAVREAFFQLFKDGLIYRGKRLVNWDPMTQTALADDEVEMQEIDGHFWYMKYPVVESTSATSRDREGAVSDGNAWQPTGEYVTVATTRPETMLGDTAVAMHPKDPRAAELVGKHVRLPIVNRIIPIIADDYVVLPDPEASDEKARYSSGFLKVTPAHDPNDWEIGQRFELPVINVMALDASISKDHGWSDWDDTPRDPFCETLLGMDRYEAREAIVSWFREKDLLADVKPYRHSVGHSYRSHVPVEPYLSDQWYVKVTDDKLAGAALRAMASDQRKQTDGDHERPATSRDREGAVSDDATSTHAYLITFTTYGTWLHGDPRGSVDRDHNLPGTPVLHGDEGRERAEFDQQKQSAFELDQAQRQAVQSAIIEVCEHRAWRLTALHVRTNHVHIVVQTDNAPERAMNDFKSYATRHLREMGLVSDEQQVWTRHGSTRWLNEDSAIAAAARYVVESQGNAMEPMPVDRRGETAPLRSRLVTGAQGEGKLRFFPERYARTFQHWHENLRDWCISRQLWWGHRIPVWTKTIDREYNRQHGPKQEWDSFPEPFSESGLREDLQGKIAFQSNMHADGTFERFITVKPGHPEIERELEAAGFTQDPDVLDTWFSSALWPISTMGWPDDSLQPETRGLLDTYNPGHVLCTAREIITLWVSRMVMFNIYFRDCLPFEHVFIHAMIQDGEGQKMSKSLGNGVDPLDIIHSHGSDAMRMTLAQMTTDTQDVRMPVDLICPHTGEVFTPRMITNKAGYRVAAPIQDCPTDAKKKMVTSYGLASGEAKVTDAMPLARNTSSKFDYGRNFANKLWNAVRFALSRLEDAARPADDAKASSAGYPENPPLTLADRWILSRLARTVRETNDALADYEFNVYAETLYDFIWRDFCDWYIEAIKPTVSGSAVQQRLLAVCIDASLRLLHPVMPFITEKLWERLNDVAPVREISGVSLQPAGLLVHAQWPDVPAAMIDEHVERNFDFVREVVGAIRQARTQYKVPPRQTVTCSCQAPAATASTLLEHNALVATLCNIDPGEIGPKVAKPADAAVAVVGDAHIYLHGLIDSDTERQRLTKRIDELTKNVKALEGRLANKSYVEKAPEKLVNETRAQLAAAQRELESLERQLGALA